MGIPMSLLGKLGVPGVESLATDQVYDKYFSKEKITDFPKFHIAFIDLCNEMNTILPGRHYTVVASREELKTFFDDWKDKKEQKKEVLVEFARNKIKEHKSNEKAMIFTGLVVPPAAIFLKTFEEKPQLKKFRLNLVPNVVFVPACTFLSLVGVRIFQIKSTTKS